MELIIPFVVGIVINRITEFCKKFGWNPKIVVTFLILLIATIYTFIRQYIPEDVVQHVVSFALQSFAVATSIHSYFLKYMPKNG